MSETISEGCRSYLLDWERCCHCWWTTWHDWWSTRVWMVCETRKCPLHWTLTFDSGHQFRLPKMLSCLIWISSNYNFLFCIEEKAAHWCTLLIANLNFLIIRIPCKCNENVGLNTIDNSINLNVLLLWCRVTCKYFGNLYKCDTRFTIKRGWMYNLWNVITRFTIKSRVNYCC